ncbi:MAG: hypothetical protein MUF47_05720 [Porphyrobacter sp.]|jgi:hypothetical protein|nr:hypothetical protein [Porphyrobacter sp.]
MISARPLRLALAFAGGLLLVLGLLWALQGLGLVQWPADSAMLADRDWAAYGLVATAIGAAILRWAGRMDRA